VDTFYYPSNGTGTIYESIQRKVEKKNKIHLLSTPSRVEHNGKKIISVEISTEYGKSITKEPDWLLSSIPITEFVHLLHPQPPREVINASEKLRFRSQVFLFITIDKESVSPDQWIYFPPKEIPFGRISEMKNFSAKMSPPGKTSLMIEFFCWEGDATWEMEKEKLLALAMEWLEKLGLVKRQEVMDYFVHKQRNVYPVYDVGYEENLRVVKDYLNRLENLEYMGRPGRFKYTNQDHSLEMGILAARTIIEGKKYDLDLVGSENEYFENGTIGKQNVY
jgi:protoporphyrinogen oxidase